MDVTHNINLERLWFGGNLLNSLDLSQNVNLSRLLCNDNFLTSLDLSQNLNLEILDCSNNLLTSLDLRQNSNLWALYCLNNQLTSLLLNNGNNNNMEDMFTIGNENLICIQVDDENATHPICDLDNIPNTGWCIDDWSSYSEDCVLGITEQNLAASLQLYPNPIKDVLQVSTQNGVELKQIQVYDVMGKLVLESKSASLDFTGLLSGLYFVEVETNQGVLVKRVVRE